MSKLILFWHRRDLRVEDNLGLQAAVAKSNQVVGVFCLDQYILSRDDIAPARVSYMIGCLAQLQENYHNLGSQLLILAGKPEVAIVKLANVLEAREVIWNLDVEPYSRLRDDKVRQILAAQQINVTTYWDSLLHAPGEILTKSSQEPYKVYTPFWRSWSQQKKSPPVDKISQPLLGLSPEKLTLAQQTGGVIDLPSAAELGFAWENPLLLAPGETSASQQLEYFTNKAIFNYAEQRNFPAIEGTSQLSAALKFGAIGIRKVWQATLEAYQQTRSDEARESIITWQKELAWREFYQHCLYFFPQLAEGAYRQPFKHFPWENNLAHFQAWCRGETGYPIVDAAMQQLNQTGWMHNRCRMIVASFLTKDLIIDWRWGEKYFMQKLYDGDLAANNGGWQWSASSGMDPKPLRIFNPASQAKKFDPEAEYIRTWLPQLSSLETEDLISGKIPLAERQRCNYVEPIVDHKVQQGKFKKLYKQVTANQAKS